jgi:hypothetical protein
MNSQTLFAFGAVIFISTSLATLMYGYTILRRNFTAAIENTSPPPPLYVRPDWIEQQSGSVDFQ